VSPIAMNMIGTCMNAMIYESNEKDAKYQEKRHDYMIIREVPLGIGRIIGLVLFLTIRKYFDMEELYRFH
jgi:MFS transporter, YQGE family, putative transporter